jgi:hypothetical protein
MQSMWRTDSGGGISLDLADPRDQNTPDELDGTRASFSTIRVGDASRGQVQLLLRSHRTFLLTPPARPSALAAGSAVPASSTEGVCGPSPSGCSRAQSSYSVRLPCTASSRGGGRDAPVLVAALHSG